MLTVESRHHWFRAELEDSDDGISVVFWRKMSRGDEFPYARIGSLVMGVPMHVALDRVTEAVQRLEVEKFRNYTGPGR